MAQESVPDFTPPGLQAPVVHWVVLVRHAESTANNKFTMGKEVSAEHHHTAPLTPVGVRQAEDVAAFLLHNKEPPDTVEISPLPRTQATAAPFLQSLTASSNLLSTRVRTCLDLAEYNKRPTISLPLPMDIWESDQVWTYAQDISLAAFDARVNAVRNRWKAVGTPHRPHRTIVFGHSLFIARLLSTEHDYHLQNGSISLLGFDTRGCQLVMAVNMSHFLRDATGTQWAWV